MQADAIRDARKRQDHTEELTAKGWYHSFQMPDGTLIEGVNPLPRLLDRFGAFPIPTDLHGKRVLDIGAWDGWFSFEAERRGAAVTSIDCVEAPHFVELQRKLSSQVDYRIMEIYELPTAGLGTFDIVFMLGILYHLRHPLLALEMVCGMTTDVAIVESFVSDADYAGPTGQIPTMEFYEGYELANQFDNWVGPSVECLLAMCRSAGFARVELLRTEPYNAIVACYRKWEPPPAQPIGEPPELLSAENTVTYGINFANGKEQYISCWFRSARESIAKEDLCLDVDGLGVAAYFAGRQGDNGWAANFPLVRGLTPGWHNVRLRFTDSGFSEAQRIAVDVPLRTDRITCVGVRDSTDWREFEIAVGDVGYVACWAAGLPENADRHNVHIFLDDTRLRVTWLSPRDGAGHRQINADVAGDMPKGEYGLRIECGGVRSAPVTVRVV